MTDDDKFQEIVRAHEADVRDCDSATHPSFRPSVYFALIRESTLIAMVEQLRKDKAGMVEAIKSGDIDAIRCAYEKVQHGGQK